MIRRNPSFRRFVQVLSLSAAAMGALVASPREARAEEVTPTAKGIVGTALLGGEVVVFTEALLGVRSPAAYIIGASAGAVAGGVGGYFIEQSVDDGRIPAYLLAGGLAALIPAVVVTLDATRYLPSENAREDRPVQSLPPSDPGKPGGSAVVGAEAPATTAPATPATPPAEGTAPAGTTEGGGSTGGGTKGPVVSRGLAPRAPSQPGSLFDVGGGMLRLGVPTPDVRPILGATERKAMGVANSGSEIRFTVARFTF